MYYNIDEQRERLGRRLAVIRGMPVSREIKRYRATINKRDAIDARGAKASIQSTPKGARYKASDEIMLCHAFLDSHNVDPCHIA